MPGTGTLGKLFFNFFLKDLAGAGAEAASAKKRRKSGVYRLTTSPSPGLRSRG
jgi:hypothetical protein